MMQIQPRIATQSKNAQTVWNALQTRMQDHTQTCRGDYTLPMNAPSTSLHVGMHRLCPQRAHIRNYKANTQRKSTHLSQLLCRLASVSTRCVYECHNGQSKLVCVSHEAQSLAVAVGLGHAEIASNVLLRRHNQSCVLFFLSCGSQTRNIAGHRSCCHTLIAQHNAKESAQGTCWTALVCFKVCSEVCRRVWMPPDKLQNKQQSQQALAFLTQYTEITRSCACMRTQTHKHTHSHTHLGVASLLVPDEHEGCAVHAANATHDGRVIQTSAISVQLHKLVRDVEDDV